MKNTDTLKSFKDHFSEQYSTLGKLEKDRDCLLDNLTTTEVKIADLERKLVRSQKSLVERIVDRTLEVIVERFGVGTWDKEEKRILYYYNAMSVCTINLNYDTIKYLDRVQKLQYKIVVRLTISVPHLVLPHNNIIPGKIFSKSFLLLINVDKNFEASVNFHELEKSIQGVIFALKGLEGELSSKIDDAELMLRQTPFFKRILDPVPYMKIKSYIQEMVELSNIVRNSSTELALLKINNEIF